MVSDPNWFNFKEETDSIVETLMTYFPGCGSEQRMLSVVMPGHFIEPHKDWQSPKWRCRVHVPLTTNTLSKFIVGGIDHHMEIGSAYMVNTEAEHSVENDGDSPRIHFMFDVKE